MCHMMPHFRPPAAPATPWPTRPLKTNAERPGSAAALPPVPWHFVHDRPVVRRYSKRFEHLRESSGQFVFRHGCSVLHE